MLLTVQQVAEKLGVSRSVVHRMIRDKELIPANSPKEGAKKFYAKFQAKDINAYKKANGTSKRPRRVVKNVTPVPNVLARMSDKLEELSAKIDALYNMWK